MTDFRTKAMVTKAELVDWVERAVRDGGGRASIIDVADWVWRNHEAELRRSGDLFFTWQYDIRWAATTLRKRGVLRAAAASPRGVWELAR